MCRPAARTASSSGGSPARPARPAAVTTSSSDMRAHQRAAGVGGHAVAEAAEQRRTAARPAPCRGCPTGDVDGRQRQREDAARPGSCRRRCAACRRCARLMGSSPTSARPARRRPTFSAPVMAAPKNVTPRPSMPSLVGNLDDHDVASGTRRGLAVGQRLIRRQPHDLRPDAFDFHGSLPGRSRLVRETCGQTIAEISIAIQPPRTAGSHVEGLGSKTSGWPAAVT